MEAIAKLKHLRVAPRKVRMAADLIRGRSIKQAQGLLEFSLKKTAEPIKKLLDSAVANAVNNLELIEDSLVISEIFVDEGPKLKRWRARSRGRAAPIQKKTSHITIVLQGDKIKVKSKPKPDIDKPIATTEKMKEIDKKEVGKEEQKETVEQKARSLEKTRSKRKESQQTKSKLGGLKKIFRRKSF